MGSVFMAAATLATSTACRAARAAESAARPTAEGKPPGPVHEHPDGQTSVVGVEQGLRAAVGQADLLTPDAFGAEVGVLSAEALGLGERRVGQFPQWQCREFRVDSRLMVIHAA